MKIFRSFATIVFLVFLTAVIGCGKSETKPPSLIHSQAVFYAEAGGNTGSSPVLKNSKMDEDGQASEYQGGMLLQQGTIEIRYEFVGTTFCPVSADGKQWNHADVYVVVVTDKRHDSVPVTIPVVFRGDEVVVVATPDLRVSIR